MTASPADLIQDAIGQRPRSVAPLAGGSVGVVWRAAMPDGTLLVAKTDDGGGLAIEGWMLGYLAARSALPVPQVVHCDDRLLLMTYIESGDPIDAGAEPHAAELLAALHGVAAPRYGLDRDTVIGGLRQPNDESDSWLDFFRDRRLLHMAEEAHRARRLPVALLRRIGALADGLDRWIDAPSPPGLVHGDMWTGNVLVRGGRIAGFVDPALCYADPEIELAFATLFGTFGAPFFERYDALRPIRPGFFEGRCDLYNLWPLLVHVRLFGGGYVDRVAATLDRLGA